VSCARVQLRLIVGWEAPVERATCAPVHFGGQASETLTRWCPRGRSQLRLRTSKRAASSNSGGFGQRRRDEDSAVPRLRSGSGEALCDVLAGTLPLVATCCEAQGLRSPLQNTANTTLRAFRLRRRIGLARAGREDPRRSSSEVPNGTGDIASLLKATRWLCPANTPGRCEQHRRSRTTSH